jgi:hypothetical protein
MLIHFDPSEHETVVTHRTCEYHKKHPEHRSYAGCTCTSSYVLQRKQKKVRKPRRLRS